MSSDLPLAGAADAAPAPPSAPAAYSAEDLRAVVVDPNATQKDVYFKRPLVPAKTQEEQLAASGIQVGVDARKGIVAFNQAVIRRLNEIAALFEPSAEDADPDRNPSPFLDPEFIKTVRSHLAYRNAQYVSTGKLSADLEADPFINPLAPPVAPPTDVPASLASLASVRGALADGMNLGDADGTIMPGDDD